MTPVLTSFIDSSTPTSSVKPSPHPPQSNPPSHNPKMASIGPQLPPDLTKRKRASTSPNPSSPSAKQARHSPLNTNEIDLSDSDSDYGPSAPANAKATIGPSLPSTKQNDQEIDLSSDSDTGPKPQPQPQPSSQPHPNEDSSSDSDYGPSLPTSTSKRPTQGPSLPSSQAPQRDTWMLAPPTSTSYTERDPTRMRNRKFASKPTPTSSTPTIWTETPEEKLKRQKDALLGRTTETTSPRRKTEQDERDRKIAENIEAHRGKSLYDEHATKRKGEGRAAEEDDDPSKRAFDREKDMALGGKIGEKQRRELISKSAGFGGRFQKGSFL